ncbi:MAG: hypothetical protein EBY11_12025 [Proteobacteria bacterium]|nr:hypothetical protein [Pseudomonadota bacterium]
MRQVRRSVGEPCLTTNSNLVATGRHVAVVHKVVVDHAAMATGRVVIVVRASSTATGRVVIVARASSTVTGREVIVARASLIAMTAARAATATARAVRVDSIAVIETNLSVRRRLPIFVAPRSFTARVAASTAKTTRSSHVARMTTAKSLTRAQCAHRVSVIRVAMSDAQPTSALAISVP